MRRSALASILETLELNIRHRERLAFFEIGPVFIPVEGQLLPEEASRLCLGLSGLRHPGAWDQKGGELLDFFDLKGIVEALLHALHIREFCFESTQHPSFHPGKCARLTAQGEEVGVMGELHPKVKENYDFMEAPVLAAELDADALYRLGQMRFESKPVPAYPPVIEDLAVIVSEGTPSIEVVETIHKAGGFLLQCVELFDIFRGEQAGIGNKSLAYRLTWQAPDRTLNDSEVGKLRQRVIQTLEKKLKAKVRRAE